MMLPLDYYSWTKMKSQIFGIVGAIGIFASSAQAAGVRGPLFISPVPITFRRQSYRHPSHSELQPFTQRSMVSASKPRSAELVQRYLSLLLTVKLISLNDAPISRIRIESARSEHLEPTAGPSTTTEKTTEDPFWRWTRVGSCRYRAFIDQMTYHEAKKDCVLFGARLTSPDAVGTTKDLASLSTKVGLVGVSFWVGVEEDPNGNDLSSQSEPRYSENGPFAGQECLAIVARGRTIITSYRPCHTRTSAHLCQVCL